MQASGEMNDFSNAAQRLAEMHAQVEAASRIVQNDARVAHRRVPLLEHESSAPLPPPSLSRTSPTCQFNLFACGIFGICALSATILFETPLLLLDHNGDHFRNVLKRSGGGPAKSGRGVDVQLGLWDSSQVLTSLQLTVALSLALDIDELHIAVTSGGEHFFTATIFGEGEWVIDVVNGDTANFLSVLNVQASRFSAKLVITHSATLVHKNATRPAD